MSVVALRNGTMAADSGARSGAIKEVATKIYRLHDVIVGFAGNIADGLAFVEWTRRGGDTGKLPEFRQYRGPDDAPAFTAIVATKDGASLWTEHFQPTPIEGPYYAVGCGAEAAMGAMWAGASAPEAVEAACAVIEGCDLPVVKFLTGGLEIG